MLCLRLFGVCVDCLEGCTAPSHFCSCTKWESHLIALTLSICSFLRTLGLYLIARTFLSRGPDLPECSIETLRGLSKSIAPTRSATLSHMGSSGSTCTLKQINNGFSAHFRAESRIVFSKNIVQCLLRTTVWTDILSFLAIIGLVILAHGRGRIGTLWIERIGETQQKCRAMLCRFGGRGGMRK